MSASEKLKLLEAKVEGNPAHVAVLTMMDALPQIVAVVRVLECQHSDPDNSGRCIKCQATLDEGNPWDDALTALEEALG